MPAVTFVPKNFARATSIPVSPPKWIDNFHCKISQHKHQWYCDQRFPWTGVFDVFNGAIDDANACPHGDRVPHPLTLTSCHCAFLVGLRGVVGPRPCRACERLRPRTLQASSSCANKADDILAVAPARRVTTDALLTLQDDGIGKGHRA